MKETTQQALHRHHQQAIEALVDAVAHTESDPARSDRSLGNFARHKRRAIECESELLERGEGEVLAEELLGAVESVAIRLALAEILADRSASARVREHKREEVAALRLYAEGIKSRWPGTIDAWGTAQVH